MRIQYAVALVVAIGLAFGAIASRGLAAQGKRTVYVVIVIDEVTDAEGFEALVKRGPSSIVEVKDADGRYLARTENITALDGTAPKAFAVVAFDSVEKAKGYYENMKQTTAMRMKATKSRSFIVEGL